MSKSRYEKIVSETSFISRNRLKSLRYHDAFKKIFYFFTAMFYNYRFALKLTVTCIETKNLVYSHS
jgi:hypothetical protein